MARASSDLVFTAPGPGHWTADNTHWPRPCTRIYTEIQPEGFRSGFREACTRYGLLIDHVAAAWINGVMYTSPRPVAEKDVPARVAAAADAFERRLWREDLRRWDEEDKPASVRAHLALQAVDPTLLAVDDLMAHIDRCRLHLQAMTAQHHRYNGASFLPVGDFLVHAVEWTNASQAELLELIAGTAPASRGDSEELSRLVTVLVGGPPSERALIEADDDPKDVLAALAALPGESGTAAREYLDLVSYRLLDGLDIGEPYALEQPDVLLRAIRIRLNKHDDSGSRVEEREERVRSMRERVPAGERQRFDELLGEARLVHRLREERGLYSDVWAIGLVRRALLAAGTRLADSGAIGRPQDLVEAGHDEIRALLVGASGPSAAELAARAVDRASRRSTDAPGSLGDAPAPPPPLDALPAPTGRAMRALLAVLGGVFADADASSDETTVRGLAASAVPTRAAPGFLRGRRRFIGSGKETFS